MVSIHWGTEWQTEPDEQQLTLGRALTASRTGGRPDIDLILGTHAHIPQAYEKVNGAWIVYGEGDQIAGEMFNESGERDERGNMSSIARFTFVPPRTPEARWEVSKAEFIPQWIDVDRGRVLNLPEALAASPGREDYAEAEDEIRTAVLQPGRGEGRPDDVRTDRGPAGPAPRLRHHGDRPAARLHQAHRHRPDDAVPRRLRRADHHRVRRELVGRGHQAGVGIAAEGVELPAHVPDAPQPLRRLP